MFEGGDGAQQEPGDRDPQHLLQCPHCHNSFTQKKGLLKHINFHCKVKVLPASQEILPSPRRVITPPVKLRHDQELDGRAVVVQLLEEPGRNMQVKGLKRGIKVQDC